MSTVERRNTITTPRRRFPQFGVRELMIAVLAVALVCSCITTELRRSNLLCNTQSKISTCQTASGKVAIANTTYAYRFGKLVWVVFQYSDTGYLNGIVLSDSEENYRIELPSGKTMPLPGSSQIYEYSNGKLIEYPDCLDISKREFNAYLAAENPADFGFDTLKEFIEQRRSAASSDNSGN